MDGNDYVDLIMGFGPNPLGHSPDVVVEAVREAVAHGTSLAIATPLEVELAQTISRLVPSMEVMRFVVTGTEATMMALRTARAFTGRLADRPFRRPLPRPARRRARQRRARRRLGGPSGARSPTARASRRASSTTSSCCPGTRSTSWRRSCARSRDDLAAIILEPVPFSNIGGEEPDPEFLRALRELTWERGVLLIFDEVITGFRLGLGGAAAHFGFAPDLHCFGKAVGGGFPVGVFGGRRDVMEAVVTPRPG